jgi:hypothetical protein
VKCGIGSSFTEYRNDTGRGRIRRLVSLADGRSLRPLISLSLSLCVSLFSSLSLLFFSLIANKIMIMSFLRRAAFQRGNPYSRHSRGAPPGKAQPPTNNLPIPRACCLLDKHPPLDVLPRKAPSWLPRGPVAAQMLISGENRRESLVLYQLALPCPASLQSQQRCTPHRPRLFFCFVSSILHFDEFGLVREDGG